MVRFLRHLLRHLPGPLLDIGDGALIHRAQIAAAVEHTAGRAPWPTRAEAQWAVRLAHVASDLPVVGRWLLDRLYDSREARGAPTRDLDS